MLPKRSTKILNDIPLLLKATFNNSGDIIYAVALEVEEEEGDRYETSFKTFDAGDYSSIGTYE